MLGECFYWILSMSVGASLAGLVVLLVRAIRRIPRRVTVFLWIAPFLRMCVPVGMNSPYSVMVLLTRLGARTVTVMGSVSLMNAAGAAESYFPITYKTDVLAGVFGTAALVWLVGALSIILTLAILYAATMREIRDARPLDPPVYLSEKVCGPAVYGIFGARILLPVSFEGKDCRHVLRHERTHIRRRDNLWRMLGFLAAAIHWFNPLSWIFLRLFLSDLEFACDESAVAGYDEEERREYARTLLSCAEDRRLCASAFGGAKIRTRIERVLSFRRMTVLSAVSFAVLAAAVVCVLVTNAG